MPTNQRNLKAVSSDFSTRGKVREMNRMIWQVHFRSACIQGTELSRHPQDKGARNTTSTYEVKGRPTAVTPASLEQDANQPKPATHGRVTVSGTILTPLTLPTATASNNLTPNTVQPVVAAKQTTTNIN